MTSGFLITRTSWWSSTSAITTSAGCQPTYPGTCRLSRRSTPPVTKSAPSEWILSVPSSVKGQLILIFSLLMMFGFSKVCWQIEISGNLLLAKNVFDWRQTDLYMYHIYSTSNEFDLEVKLWTLQC